MYNGVRPCPSFASTATPLFNSVRTRARLPFSAAVWIGAPMAVEAGSETIVIVSSVRTRFISLRSVKRNRPPKASQCLQQRGSELREVSEVSFPFDFHSAPVLPPSLRRKSVVSGFAAASTGVSPSAPFAFTSAPLATRSSIILLCPSEAASCRGVHPSLSFEFTSVPAAKCCLTTSILPSSTAS